MRRSGRKKEWSVALFGIGVLAFFPPILRLYDKPLYVLGLPVAYLVIFGVWGVIIFAVARNASPAMPPPEIQPPDTPPPDAPSSHDEQGGV